MFDDKLIIGLSGAKRAGKNTVADLLTAEYGLTQISLAAPVLDALLAIDPLISSRPLSLADGRYFDPPVRASHVFERVGYEVAKEVTEFRQLLQRIGTEMGREVFGPDVWVDHLKRRMAEALPDAGNGFVITDVRFSNELTFVREHGFALRVDRPEVDTDDPHPSEREWRDWSAWDGVIDNSGDLDQLFDEVDAAMAALI